MDVYHSFFKWVGNGFFPQTLKTLSCRRFRRWESRSGLTDQEAALLSAAAGSSSHRATASLMIQKGFRMHHIMFMLYNKCFQQLDIVFLWKMNIKKNFRQWQNCKWLQMQRRNAVNVLGFFKTAAENGQWTPSMFDTWRLTLLSVNKWLPWRWCQCILNNTNTC